MSEIEGNFRSLPLGPEVLIGLLLRSYDALREFKTGYLLLLSSTALDIATYGDSGIADSGLCEDIEFHFANGILVGFATGLAGSVAHDSRLRQDCFPCAIILLSEVHRRVVS